MPILIFSMVAALVFLLGDSFMIPYVMRPLFLAALGESMLDTLRLAPAAAFYVVQIIGLTWFAGMPFLRDGNVMRAGFNGAALGFVAYSCYEMTSWTIMRDWHAGLVIADIAWGSFISGASSWAGAMVASSRLRKQRNPVT